VRQAEIGSPLFLVFLIYSLYSSQADEKSTHTHIKKKKERKRKCKKKTTPQATVVMGVSFWFEI